MATLDEFMQAMSGKPTAASRSREFDHQQFNPNVFGADALKEWLKGVKERTLHPLEALAKYSQDFQKMSPVDQGLQLTGGGLAGTFAGVGAKTANLAKLELAQKLKQQGVPDREIYSKTGWTFGFPDSKPRFEIPDNLATMSSKPLPSEYIESVGVNEPSWKVGQVLDHSSLFSAYPDLKSIRSSFMYGQPESANYKPGMDWISYNAESMKKAVPSIKQQAIIDAHEAYTKAFYDRPDVKAWNDATDSFNFNQPNVDDAFKALSQKYGGSEIDDEAARLAQKSLDFRSLAGGGYALRGAKSPTLHELQHAIQQREGFARGGSPEMMSYEGLKNKQGELVQKMLSDFRSGKQTNQQLENELAQIDGLIREFQTTGSSGFKGYNRLAGEAEARLTQARMNMTPEQRAASYPIDMFDVPVNEQIVRYGEGNALSLPKTQYELAHELAQRNAALPVEQGGLGLLANNTAMERAKALGYPMDLYGRPHTNIGFTNRAATNAPMKKAGIIKSELEQLGIPVRGEQAQSGSTYLDIPGNPYPVNDNPIGQSIPIEQLRFSTHSKRYDGIPINEPDDAFISDVFPKHGDTLDTARQKINEMIARGGIRSRFAAFDPLKRNSPDLLASLLPITTTGLLANQLRQSLWAEPQPD